MSSGYYLLEISEIADVKADRWLANLAMLNFERHPIYLWNLQFNADSEQLYRGQDTIEV